MTFDTRSKIEFLQDLAAVVDAEAEAMEKHADLLAESDECRGLRHEIRQFAEHLADAGVDYRPPPDLEARVLAFVDTRGPAPKLEMGRSKRRSEPTRFETLASDSQRPEFPPSEPPPPEPPPEELPRVEFPRVEPPPEGFARGEPRAGFARGEPPRAGPATSPPTDQSARTVVSADVREREPPAPGKLPSGITPLEPKADQRPTTPGRESPVGVRPPPAVVAAPPPAAGAPPPAAGASAKAPAAPPAAGAAPPAAGAPPPAVMAAPPPAAGASAKAPAAPLAKAPVSPRSLDRAVKEVAPGQPQRQRPVVDAAPRKPVGPAADKRDVPAVEQPAARPSGDVEQERGFPGQARRAPAGPAAPARDAPLELEPVASEPPVRPEPAIPKAQAPLELEPVASDPSVHPEPAVPKARAPLELEPVASEPSVRPEPAIPKAQAPLELEPVASEPSVRPEPAIPKAQAPLELEPVASDPSLRPGPVVPKAQAPLELEPVASEPPVRPEPAIPKAQAPLELEPVALEPPAQSEPGLSDDGHAEPVITDDGQEGEPEIVDDGQGEPEIVGDEPPAAAMDEGEPLSEPLSMDTEGEQPEAPTFARAEMDTPGESLDDADVLPPSMELPSDAPAAALPGPEQTAAAPEAKKSRWKWLLAGAGTLVVLVLAAAGYLYWLKRQESASDLQVAAPISVHVLQARISRLSRAAAAGDAVSGIALSERAGAPARASALGAVVKPGARVKTDGRTRARLDLSDGGFLVLNHDTEIGLDAARQRHVEVSSGEVLVEAAAVSGGPPLVLSTPSGRVEVMGTGLDLSVAAATAVVRVIRGTVSVHPRGKGGAEVAAGKQAVMSANAPPRIAPMNDLGGVVGWAEIEEEGKQERARGLGELRVGRSDEAEEEGEDEQRSLPIAEHLVRVDIVGNLARTEIEEAFVVEGAGDGELEGLFAFPLPADATLVGLDVQVDGVWQQGQFARKQGAPAASRERGRAAASGRKGKRSPEYIWPPGPWQDPDRIEWQRGGNLLLPLSPLAAGAQWRIRLAYVQVVPPLGEGRRYRYPLPHASDATPVGRFRLDVRLQDAPGDSIRPRGFSATVSERDGARFIGFEQEAFVPAGELGVDYRLPQGEAGIRWWTWSGEPASATSATASEEEAQAEEQPESDSGKGNAYLALALRPRLAAPAGKQARDYVLVLDASQSMAGERFDRARELAERLVSEMDASDHFLLLACDATCQAMTEQPLEASVGASARTGSWLKSIEPAGASDLGAALREARRAIEGKSPAERMVRIIYLGDGNASAGHRRPDLLAAETGSLVSGEKRMSISTVSIGSSADAALLSALARAAGGHHLSYLPGQRVGEAALSVLETGYGAVLENTEIKLPEGIEQVAPGQLPSLRSGQELVVVGRLGAGEVKGEATLSGQVAGQSWSASYPLQLQPAGAGGSGLLAGLWAERTVASLEGEDDLDSRSRIIDLSIRYAVPSRYTALRVLENQVELGAPQAKLPPPAYRWSAEEDPGAGEILAGLVDSGQQEAREGKPGRRGRGRRDERDTEFERPFASGAPTEDGKADTLGEALPEAEPGKRGRRGEKGAGRDADWFARSSRSIAAAAASQSELVPGSSAPPSELKIMDAAAAAVRQEPDSRDRNRILVRALCRVGNLERARQVIEGWLERDARDPEALAFLSEVLGRQGKRQEAIRVLSGILDLRPDDAVLQRRLALGFERAGMAERACSHRVALAEMAMDDADAVAAAVRCQRELGREQSAERLLAALDDERTRERAREAASEPVAEPEAGERVAEGELLLAASWAGDADLDLSLITPGGARLSWLGGRAEVVASQVAESGRERLGLTDVTDGTYVIEVSRIQQGEGAPVKGRISVNLSGESRDLPFNLAGERAVVGRLTVKKGSRLAPR